MHSHRRSHRRVRSAGVSTARPVFGTLETLETRRLLAGATAAIADRIVGESIRQLDGEEISLAFSPKATVLQNVGGWLTGPQLGRRTDAARAVLNDFADRLGLSSDDIAASYVHGSPSDPGSGLTHVYLKQTVNGLPVSNADAAVHFARDGRVLTANSTFIPNLAAAAASAGRPVLSEMIHPANALRKAADFLGLSYDGSPNALRYLGGDNLRFNITDGQLSEQRVPVKAEYYADADGLKLVWNFYLDLPTSADAYDLKVDARTGNVVFANNLTSYLHDGSFTPGAGSGSGTAARPTSDANTGSPSTAEGSTASYNVYALPSESPYDGPRTIVSDPWEAGGTDPATSPSPYGWHDTDGDLDPDFTDTRGNNVSAQEDRDFNNTGGFRPSGGAGAPLNFDFPIDFTQAPQTYESAAITNLFYFNNILHDVSYKYGFTEQFWNFQVNNYGRGGVGNDAVQADAQDGSGSNNANFATFADGTPGRMQMFLWTAPTPDLDGDLDNGIIAHEYAHGISNRLTTKGTGSMSSTQSRGMGEGWSDFHSLMFQQKPSDTSSSRHPIGTYALNQDPNTGAGIRTHPYSFDTSINPITWGYYGSGTYQSPYRPGVNVTRSTAVHWAGTIWAATLWDMNWLLINKHGYDQNLHTGYNGSGTAAERAGNKLAMRLVIDALKLQVNNPSFTVARDAILQADVALTGGANQREIWTAFARRGLGFSVAAQTASSTTTITPAFDLPPSLQNFSVTSATPAGALADAPVSSFTLTFNKAIDPASFSLNDDVLALTGPGGVDLLPSVTGVSIAPSNQTVTINVTPQRANGAYQLVLAPTVLAGDNGQPLDQDGDGTAGEAVEDRYTLNVTKSGAAGPRVSAQAPTGTVSGSAVSSATFTFSEAIDPASFSLADISSFTGPGGADLSGAISGFSWTNATTLQVNFAPQRANGSYSMVIGPQIGAALDGVLLDQDADGTPAEATDDRYTFSVSKSGAAGPRITAATPTGTLLFTSLTQFDFTFSEAMNAASFSVADDIAAFTGPGGIDLKPAITGFSWLNATTLRVTTTAQSVGGTYSITVGPQVLAQLDGAALDQDSDGTAGEPTADAFTTSLTLDRYPGPEAFGYEMNLYPVENIDLVVGAPGVTTLVNTSDDGAAAINLGTNTFNYYGTVHTGAASVFANANGLVSFGSSTTNFTNGDLTSSPSQRALAVLWDDWRTDLSAPGATDSAVLTRLDDLNGDTVPDRLVIEWSDVTNRVSTDGSATFQAILQLNTGANPGRIFFNYVDITAGSATQTNGGSSTVGIKDTGTQGVRRLLLSQNRADHPWVGNGRAVLVHTDVVPPTVTAGGFQFLTGESFTATFSEDVGASLGAADLVLRNDTTGITVAAAAQAVGYDAGSNTATFTAPGLGATGLEDGNYTARLLSSGLSDAAGNPLDGDGDLVSGGDRLFSFFVLAGDANRDRSVDIGDFSTVAANFNAAGNFAQGDFDYTGTVDIADFSILAAKFNTGLPAPLVERGVASAQPAPVPANIGTTSPFRSGRLIEDVLSDGTPA